MGKRQKETGCESSLDKGVPPSKSLEPTHLRKGTCPVPCTCPALTF